MFCEDSEFKDRIDIACTNLGHPGGIVSNSTFLGGTTLDDRTKYEVSLPQFAEWAMRIGWEIPSELVELAETAPSHVRRQRPWNSLRDLRKGGFLAHRHHSGVNDETENGTPTGCRRTHDQGHPTPDTQAPIRLKKRYGLSLPGFGAEDSIAELCRQEGIAQGLYYSWSKEFLEAGKKRLAGDTAREANTGEVKSLRRVARDLKEVVAEQALELRLLKKSMIGDGEDIE